jgi:hypothetical protein
MYAIWGHYIDWRHDESLQPTRFWDCVRGSIALMLRNENEKISEYGGDNAAYSEEGIAWTGMSEARYNGSYNIRYWKTFLIDARWWVPAYFITEDQDC